MSPQDYTDVMSQLKALQLREKKLKDEDQLIQVSVREAVQEAVRVIAMTIINERRAEIEAACNFDGLREAVASELVRQFMTARFTDQKTAFDRPAQQQASNQQSNVAKALSGGYLPKGTP